jgi:hypothetical protein
MQNGNLSFLQPPVSTSYTRLWAYHLIMNLASSMRFGYKLDDEAKQRVYTHSNSMYQINDIFWLVLLELWILSQCIHAHALCCESFAVHHMQRWWTTPGCHMNLDDEGSLKDQSELGISFSLSVCNYLCTQKTPQESYKNSNSHSSQEITIIITPRGSLVHRKWHFAVSLNCKFLQIAAAPNLWREFHNSV